ncbi:hypothetical protein BIW11_04612 [Tropilaelaps mercedesae]|uniref:Uncharacterized protein n=1 Tax=Tropilaelaps mercedesae TaxID=418985 RepID=A0A1V9X448_9ACAR|nr:hypothetical protein BIW11_04612 [Tropilaelaps mercedesae]
MFLHNTRQGPIVIPYDRRYQKTGSQRTHLTRLAWLRLHNHKTKSCGACSAFVAGGVPEAHLSWKKYENVDLSASEQNVIDWTFQRLVCHRMNMGFRGAFPERDSTTIT